MSKAKRECRFCLTNKDVDEEFYILEFSEWICKVCATDLVQRLKDAFGTFQRILVRNIQNDSHNELNNLSEMSEARGPKVAIQVR